MVLAKKHMALDIWISPEHWRDAMAKLKHYRDMEYINPKLVGNKLSVKKQANGLQIVLNAIITS